MGRRVVRLRAGCCSGIDSHVEKARASETTRADEVAVAHNYGPVTDIITERVAKTEGRISAKRLLPVVRAAGYSGSARNLRRAVAEAKARWRIDHHRGRRPGVWAPGDMLVFAWGEIGPLFVFCAVLAWSRFRFVYFADNLRAETTMAALAECMETIGGVPKTHANLRGRCSTWDPSSCRIWRTRAYPHGRSCPPQVRR